MLYSLKQCQLLEDGKQDKPRLLTLQPVSLEINSQSAINARFHKRQRNKSECLPVLLQKSPRRAASPQGKCRSWKDIFWMPRKFVRPQDPVEVTLRETGVGLGAIQAVLPCDRHSQVKITVVSVPEFARMSSLRMTNCARILMTASQPSAECPGGGEHVT